MNTTKVRDLLAYFQEIVPFQYQESYDNSGLLVGDPNMEIKGVLCSLDCTENVIDDALAQGCNVIVSHHPILFKGIKSLTGKNYVERTLIKAIKNDIALIAVHTNVDNYRFGVNHIIANKLKLVNQQILVPKQGNLLKLAVFVPRSHSNVVLEALANAGAGKIGNYDSCSFSTEGTGRFRPLENSNAFIGSVNQLEAVDEVKVEVIFETHLLSKVIQAMNSAHPYEEIAHDIVPLTHENNYVGSGIIGDLEHEIEVEDFLKTIKTTFKAGVVRYTKAEKTKVKRVAVCGGSGSFLLKDAKNRGADLYLTADFKYHEFFDSENQIIIADIGHFESEQYIVDWFVSFISNKFPNFAVRLTSVNTNPINYI